MKLYCVVCSKEYDGRTKTKIPEYEGTCVSCRKILMSEAPGVSLYGVHGGGSVEDAIDELELRIPELFNGDECPLEFGNHQGCDCTFETGCRALSVVRTDKRYSKIKSIQKNDKKT